jgi:dUTP pyrophosphatase
MINIEKQLKELRDALIMDGISDMVKGNILMSIELLEKQLNKQKTINKTIDIKFINKSNNPDPIYAHEGDSGFDLRSSMEEKVILKPGERKLIDTGLFFQLPDGYELQVRPRSGNALKYGITVLNTPGTIDTHYRGEIKIILINLGQEDFIVEHGDRIAQGVVAPRVSTEFGRLIKVENLGETQRGSDGFGSTGRK